MGQTGQVEVRPTRRFASVEGYLRFDDATEEKHEYCDGEILAMAGGTPNHARIAASLLRLVGNQLVGKPCEPFGSDLRVGVPDQRSFSYPDLTVVCGDLDFDPRDRKRHTVTNPRLIVEVLSTSTERFDRSGKFKKYLLLKSLEEYVLVSQEEPLVDSFFRQADGTWLFSFVQGLESVLKIHSLNIEIPLADIFRNVIFPTPEEIAAADAAEMVREQEL